jgi:hypothetical protein
VIPKIIFKYIAISPLARVANEVKNQNTDSIEKRNLPCLGQNPPNPGSLTVYTQIKEKELMPLLHLKVGAKLGNEVTALAVVCSLILEPLSVSLHAANLFAVVIGDRVRNRVGGRVNTESLNTVEELFLFLRQREQVVSQIQALIRVREKLTVATEGLYRR